MKGATSAEDNSVVEEGAGEKEIVRMPINGIEWDPSVTWMHSLSLAVQGNVFENVNLRVFREK